MTAPTFRKSTVREYAESIVIAVILALFVRTWVVQAFKIPTGSMENNLLIGDHLLVNKFVFGPTVGRIDRALLPIRDIRRGDVIVFKYPDEPDRDFIKRVIGLPGETVAIGEDGGVTVNGAALGENGYTYAGDDGANEPTTPQSDQATWTLGPDELFVKVGSVGRALSSRMSPPIE